MKKIVLSLLMLAASLSVLGQQRSTLRGKIVDADTNEPLFGATVVVDSVKNGMADQSGAFSVTDIPRGQALVEVYSLGYETITRTVNFNQGTINLGTIQMKEVGNAIEEVVVTAAANPVIQRGDTTQFNAAAFKTNPDADATDLVAKMPGMEVSSDGVKAQGESVARVYVNDELFFGDDAMTALSNLPADLVESIQMFDELPDDAKFSGFNDGRTQRALNVVTKGGKINRTIDARIEAGYGQELQRDIDGKYQSRYDVGGRLNYITPTSTINLNGIVNNLNQMRFGGGGFSGRGGGPMGGGGGGLQTINNFGGNYTAKLNEKNRLSISYNYDGNKTRQNSLTLSDYYATNNFDSRIVRDTTSSRSTRDSHSINLRYDYEGDKDRVRITARGSLGSNDSQRFNINEESRDGSPYSLTEKETFSEGNSYSINSMVDWSHRLGQKAGRTFGIQGNFSFSENTSDGVEDSDLTKFYEGETNPNRIYWDTNSESFSRSFGMSFNYNEPLSDKMRLNFNYRPSYNYSSSERIRTDLGGDMDSLVSERFTYDYFVHMGRVGFSYNQQDKFNFSASLSAQSASRAQTMELPQDYEMDRSFSSLLPTFSFRYYVQKTKYFNINYNTSSRIPSIEQLSNVVDVSNPLRYTAGNADLKQDYTHSLNLRYNTNNIERSTNFYTSLQASFTQNSIQSKTIYFSEDRVLPQYGDFVFEKGTSLVMPVNAGDAFSINAGAGYGFVFRPLKLNVNLGGNYRFSRTPSYVGETLNTVNNNTAMFILGINSNISQNIDFTVNSMTSYGTTNNPSSRNKETFSERVDLRLNYIFLGGFVFNTNYSFNYSNTLEDPYHVWNAYIGRKFLKNNSAEFRIEVSDILNQSRNYSYTYGTQSEIESWSRVIGRYVLAKIVYRFNSLQSQANQYGQQGPGGMPSPEQMREMRERGGGGGGAPVMMGPPPGGGGPGRF